MPGIATRSRTIVYVDGFNLYYGLRQAGLRDCYWLDIRGLATQLVSRPFVLSETKYFTSRISGRHDGDSDEKASERDASRIRQQTYLEALDEINTLQIFEGKYLLKREYCRSCGNDFYRAEEKMTDVCIATEMMADAFLDRFDSAIIISADSDLVPPIVTIKNHFEHKRIVVAFPPHRNSSQLRQIADATLNIWPGTLRKCQMPDEIVKANGTILRRPAEWT